MEFKGSGFKYFFNNESKTIEEIKELVDNNTTVSVKGLEVHYFSPKKELNKTEKLLKEAEQHQKQNGGRIESEFPCDYMHSSYVGDLNYDNPYAIWNSSRTITEEKQITEAKTILGKKHNEGKLPIDIMLTVQFPKAIQAVCKATLFGHEKYKETDKDWLNYKRVKGGSTTYANAGQRHNFNKSVKDEQSGLPHIIHKCWNALAELELWIEENKYE